MSRESRIPGDLGDTRTTYDRVAAEYTARIAGELADKPLDRALLACFAEEVRELGTVADIGCGPGHVTAYLHGLGVPMIGIDLSPEMVAIARTSAPGVPFEQGSMLALNASDASWGGIVAPYSIIHLPPDTRPQAFAEFFRVLRPGGLLMLAFHIGDEQRHLDEWWGQPVSLDIWFFQPPEIEALLRNAGFAIEMSLVRQPYAPEVEHQSQRAYLFARKPVMPAES
ncbi:MAG TPA: methyltransferase domain-containing protein [Ktedonobacterales bacterium]|nr:methyltransferase domain-containing protein [Ktedonobacterales bacterium]